MVRDEADRADHHGGGPFGGHPVHLGQEVGADPRVGGAPGALPGRAPGHGRIGVEAEPGGDVGPGPGHLVGVGVARRPPTRWGRLWAVKNTAVRVRAAGSSPSRTARVRSARRSARPGARYHEGTTVRSSGGIGAAGGRGPARREVLARTHRRPVRGQHDARRPGRPPAAARSAIPSSMVGWTYLVPSRTVNRPGRGRLEGGGQTVDLGPGARGQGRRATDRRVAAGQLGQQLGRGRPAPSDAGVEGLDLLGRVRRPVGHDQHAGRSWPDRPGTVPVGRHAGAALGVHEADDLLEDARVGLGQDAVAEVEDVAGGGAGPLGGPRGSRPRPRPSGRGTGPGRGCPGRRCRAPPAGGPRRAVPASRCRPPRCRPWPSGGGARRCPRRRGWSGCRGARPRGRRTAAGWRAARARRSAGERMPAQLSNTWTAEAPASSWDRSEASAMSVSRSTRACHRPGSPCIRDLTLVKFLDGPPSTR